MKMKKERGITLIALIITIIVMLILVGVTVNIVINGGLITVTQEAKFKTEVREIEDGLQVRKAVLLADNLGTLENITFITIDELDIEQNLKTKFAEKLIISKESDDFVLYYNSEKVTNQEIEWLEELGIYGQLTFKQNVERIVGSIPKIEGYADFDAISSQVKQTYQTACIAYGWEYGVATTVPLANDYETYLNKKIAVEKILKIIQEAQYSDDIVIKLGTGDANINEIIDIANENSIFEISQTSTYSVGYIKETIAPMYDYDFKLCISSEEGKLIIDDIGNVENNNDPLLTLMSEQEAENMFKLVEKETEDGITYLAISSYIGTETDVKIPGAIYDENGNIVKAITEITSFSIPLQPIYSLLEMSSETYTNSNVETVWRKVTGTEYTGTNGQETDNYIKYQELLPILSSMGLTENDVVLRDNNIPYLYVENYQPLPMPETVEIETVTIPQTVENIGDKAFAYQTALTKVMYYVGNKPTISEDVFEGCTNLIEIRFPRVTWPIYRGGPIEGYETYWGAPNQNVKIYDENGEI